MEEPMQIHISNTEPLVINHTVFRSANDFSLSRPDSEKAYKELKETEETKRDYLGKLKEMLHKEQIKYRTDDDYLLRYLRFRKFDCDKAFKTLKEFYSKRQRYRNIFSLPPNMESLLDTGFVSYLPYLDENGCLIFHVNFGKWTPHETPYEELLSVVMAVCDITSMNPHCQINGIRSIYNTEGSSLRQLPEFLKYSLFLVSMFQDCYPFRVQEVILLNCSSFQRAVYRQCRFLVRKKIYDRIKVLGSDYSELHQLINPDLLPKEYGGTVEENKLSITQHILHNLPYLKYERSFGCKKNN